MEWVEMWIGNEKKKGSKCEQHLENKTNTQVKISQTLGKAK